MSPLVSMLQKDKMVRPLGDGRYEATARLAKEAEKRDKARDRQAANNNDVNTTSDEESSNV